MRLPPLKRLLDVAGAGLGLVLAAPLMGAAALGIRLTMGPPALFRQQRPGLHGAPFTLYKLRTMRKATDAMGRPLPEGVRLTRLGRFLRRTSLDELPELLNVLRGEMSLVGPRPLLTRYLPHYTRHERRRHDVRPGLTGWAQIHGRNLVPWAERLALDVWYVHHQSLRLDAHILWRTLVLVLSRQGVVDSPHSRLPDLDALRQTRPASAPPRPVPGPPAAADASEHHASPGHC